MSPNTIILFTIIGIIAVSCYVVFMSRAAAVSYTHLDVYKRQAIRMAMLRAARRRGSSIITFLPCKNACSNTTSGSKVLFPAPGGALIINVVSFSRDC